MKHPVTIVPRITASQEKAHRKKSYTKAHRKANIAEIEKFGKKQFDYINKKIRRLPEKHFAATHTKRHHIHVSQEFLDLIPKNKRKSVIAELKVHEITEDHYMQI